MPGWKQYHAEPLPPVRGLEEDDKKILVAFLLPHGAHVEVLLDTCATARQCKLDSENPDVESRAYRYLKSGANLREDATIRASCCCQDGRCGGTVDARAVETEAMYQCSEPAPVGTDADDRATVVTRREGSKTLLQVTTRRFKTRKGGIAIVSVVFVARRQADFDKDLASVNEFATGLAWTR